MEKLVRNSVVRRPINLFLLLLRKYKKRKKNIIKHLPISLYLKLKS